MSEKLSEHPPWVAFSRTRDHIPSFPRKRESSGRGLILRVFRRPLISCLDGRMGQSYPQMNADERR